LPAARNNFSQTRDDLPAARHDLAQTHSVCPQTRFAESQSRHDLPQTRSFASQTRDDLRQTFHDLSQSQRDFPQSMSDLSQGRRDLSHSWTFWRSGVSPKANGVVAKDNFRFLAAIAVPEGHWKLAGGATTGYRKQENEQPRRGCGNFHGNARC
jgi:hypothetical protein